MAKEKIKGRLKALFPKANLSQKRLDALADKLALKVTDETDEATIDQLIKDYDEIFNFEEIARQDDKIRTLEAAKQKPADPPTPPPTPDPADDTPPWAKKLIESNETFKKEIEDLKTGKIKETKKQTVSDLFSKSDILKKVPKKWQDRVDVDSETPIEDQIKELETEYSELVQEAANGADLAGGAGFGSKPEKMTSESAKSIVGSILKKP